MKKLILFLFALVCSINIINAQWVCVNNGLPSINFVDALATSGTNIFAGSYGGGIYLSTNDGDLWTAVNTGLTNDTVLSLAISGTNIFAGTSGGVFLSTNNGSNWSAVNTGLTNTVVNSLAISGSNIFAGTKNGIFLSTNNGSSWTAVNNGLPANTGVYTIIISGINIFAGTIFSGVYLSTNNGNNWTAAGLSGNWVNALAISGTNIYAGNYYGGMSLSTNNGSSWTPVNNGLSASTNVHSIIINGTNIFAGTDYSVFLSNNNGGLWTDWNNGIPSYYSALAFCINGTNIFAGSGNGRVYRRALSDITEIEENIDNTSFILYPNPTKGKFIVTNEINNIDKIEICNMFGENIYTSNFKPQISNEIDISNNPKGIYFVTIYEGEKIHIEKIVVQ